MMHVTMKNIIPITDLQRQAGQIIGGLSASDEPVIITQRGRAAAVIVSAERYNEIEDDLKRLDELELIGLIDESRRAIEAGDILSQDEVKQKLNYQG
jgi:prevent-host-death family protein